MVAHQDKTLTGQLAQQDKAITAELPADNGTPVEAVVPVAQDKLLQPKAATEYSMLFLVSGIIGPGVVVVVDILDLQEQVD